MSAGLRLRRNLQVLPWIGLLPVLAGCSPTKVVTAPVQAAGQAAGAVARTTAPVVTGTAVGVATANPAAGAAAGRATQGALARPAPAAPAPPEGELVPK